VTHYIKQYGSKLEFLSGNAWVILNPIEKSIKDKIELIGIPLKNWNVNINCGIKTGCNEAFIIDKTKRNELVAKDNKSAEIICPILRGRDIKRYRYEFAEQYIIATFPSKKYDIDNYPVVRDYLLAYGKHRLEQSGKPGARKKTTHKWFETQDPIAYWDEFSKQKIVWIELVDRPNFALDNSGFLLNNTVFFINGKDIHFLIAYLNSSLCDWQFGKICATSGTGTRRWIKQYIEQLCVPTPNEKQNQEMEHLIKKIGSSNINTCIRTQLISQIDNKIFELFNLSEEEKRFVKTQFPSC